MFASATQGGHQKLIMYTNCIHIVIVKIVFTRMWTDAQREGRPAEYRWRSLRKFRNSIPCTTLLECRAVTLPNIGKGKTWTQSEYCTWQNSVRKQEPLKMHYSVSAQETAKHRAKFGWLPVSNIAAVTKPRRETR